jgi:hypothetical protein
MIDFMYLDRDMKVVHQGCCLLRSLAYTPQWRGLVAGRFAEEALEEIAFFGLLRG